MWYLSGGDYHKLLGGINHQTMQMHSNSEWFPIKTAFFGVGNTTTPVFSYALQPATPRNLHSMDHSERQLVEEIAGFVGADLRYGPAKLRAGNLFLGGGFKHFLFSPLLVEDFQFDEHIFQMGWFNHQLVVLLWEMATLGEMIMESLPDWFDPYRLAGECGDAFQARRNSNVFKCERWPALAYVQRIHIMGESPPPKLSPRVTSPQGCKSRLQKPTGLSGKKPLWIGFEGNEMNESTDHSPFFECSIQNCLNLPVYVSTFSFIQESLALFLDWEAVPA